MLTYIKNLTTFKLLFLVFLVFAAEIYLYWSARISYEGHQDRSQRERIQQDMDRTSESIADYLVAQRAAAMATAMQIELAADSISREEITRMLQRVPGATGLPVLRTVVDLTGRNFEPVIWDLENSGIDAYPYRPFTHFGHHLQPVAVSGWRIRQHFGGDGDGSRTVAEIVVGISRNGRHFGSVHMIANLSWLVGLLKEIEFGNQIITALHTPDNQAMYLRGGNLVLTDEAVFTSQPGEADQKAMVPVASAGLSAGSWRLLAWRPEITTAYDPNMLLIALFTLLALTSLVLDIVWYRQPADSQLLVGEPEPPSRIRPSLWAGIRHRLLSSIHSYRIIDLKQNRLESELRVARHIQFTLVPDTFPPFSKWREFDLHSLLEPAKEVGGDFFDYFMLDVNRLVITVGDVSGKGVPAALYMAVSRTAFRTLASQSDNPGMLLSRLNELLVRDNSSGLYVTLASFYVDLRTGEAQYSLAGHPPPLWWRPRRNTVETLDSPRETFVGLKPNVSYPVGRIRFEPGDTLLMYTDGVTEARGPGGDELESARLHDIFRQAAQADRCQQVVDRVNQSVVDFLEGGEQNDDITLLAFRFWGPGGQKMIRRGRSTTVGYHG